MDEARTSEVIFYTKNHVISGKVSLVPGARLTDFMREGSEFLAVSDVSVALPDGTELFKSSFIDLRRDSIEFAVPKDALQ